MRCATFLHGALSVWYWETVTVFCWCFWLNRFELDILHGKDKKDRRAHASDTDTHGTTKVSIYSLSGLCGLTYLPLIQKTTWVWLCGDDILPAPHTHSSERKSPATHITYLYSPIWQYLTPHSHHIGLTMEYVRVCVSVDKGTLCITCNTDVLYQHCLHCIYKQHH